MLYKRISPFPLFALIGFEPATTAILKLGLSLIVMKDQNSVLNGNAVREPDGAFLIDNPQTERDKSLLLARRW